MSKWFSRPVAWGCGEKPGVIIPTYTTCLVRMCKPKLESAFILVVVKPNVKNGIAVLKYVYYV